jgi:hypothetical protein
MRNDVGNGNTLILKDDSGVYYAIPRPVLQQHILPADGDGAAAQQGEDDMHGHWGISLSRLQQEQREQRERQAQAAQIFKPETTQIYLPSTISVMGWY